jgi:hypothetical protein
MRAHRRFVIFVALMAVSFGLGAWAHAQVGTQPVSPAVFSGADIGFRMTGRAKGDTPVGELVVRVNGEWKPVQFSYGVRPLTK